MVTPLCELAYKYGTDKCPQIRHSYTPIYYEMFKDKKETFKKILELGIGTAITMKHVLMYCPGASHKMWRDFFPNAQIYGTDIEPECMLNEERITTFLMDTGRHKNLEKLIRTIGSDLDLVVDDGPHNTHMQIRTAKTLLPLLDKGVIYIIEDCRDPERIKENLPDYECEILILPTHTVMGKMKDNNLVIIRK